MKEREDTSRHWVGLAMVHRSASAPHSGRAVGRQAVSGGSHIVVADDQSHGLADVEGGTDRIQRDIASPHGDEVEVDIDELTDRVYQLFVDQLMRERDRAAWVG